MKMPFVSRSRLDLLQHNFDEARKLHHERMGELYSVRAQLEAERADKRDLLEKYHALRQDGFSAPLQSMPTGEHFGPLTRAALHDMGHGQTGMVKRAMRTKAEALWLEQRGQDNQDEVVAITVRRGEVVG